ncbi:hypothetical protein JCM10212_003426 [Sporobolomyces blumeae]
MPSTALSPIIERVIGRLGKFETLGLSQERRADWETGYYTLQFVLGAMMIHADLTEDEVDECDKFVQELAEVDPHNHHFITAFSSTPDLVSLMIGTADTFEGFKLCVGEIKRGRDVPSHSFLDAAVSSVDEKMWDLRTSREGTSTGRAAYKIRFDLIRALAAAARKLESQRHSDWWSMPQEVAQALQLIRAHHEEVCLPGLSEPAQGYPHLTASLSNSPGD